MPSLRSSAGPARHPIAWYQVGWSHEIAPGATRAIELCGHDLVLIRTDAGELRVHDGYCPHKGAKLAVGGRVCGDRLVCPFHGWQFGADGRCVSIPRANKIPPAARLASWRVEERSGIVFVHFDPHGQRADAELPPIPELSEGRWSALVTKEQRIRARLADVVENGADVGHFREVHEMATADVDVSVGTDGNIRMRQRTAVRRMGMTFDSSLDMRMAEPSLTVSTVGGVFGTTCVVTSGITPLDDDTLIVRSGYRVGWCGLRSNLTARLIAHLGHGVFREDVPIWDNQLHLERPVLSEADRTIAQFRSWYAKFPVAEPAAPLVESGSVVRKRVPHAIGAGAGPT